MSDVYPVLDGFVGYGDGKDIRLETGTPLDSEHPLVKERPELFVPAEPEQPVRPGPGRPPGSKNKPKGSGDE